MKFIIISITVLCSFFFMHIGEASATLAPNEIKIQESSVKHGPEFGKEWSDEQKIVWNNVQEWWQLRMVCDWKNIEKLYNRDAILYPYFNKVPYNFPAFQNFLKSAMTFGHIYCTVYDIRIIENVAVVMFYYEIFDPFPPKRATFIWIKQGTDWKLIGTMSQDD